MISYAFLVSCKGHIQWQWEVRRILNSRPVNKRSYIQWENPVFNIKVKCNSAIRTICFCHKIRQTWGADSACASCVWWKIRAGHSSIWNSWKLIETFTEITQNTEITWKNETQNKISFLPLVLPFARRQNLYSVWNLYESNVLKMVCESQCEFGMWNGRKPECQNLNHSRKRKAWKKVPSERSAE